MIADKTKHNRNSQNYFKHKLFPPQCQKTGYNNFQVLSFVILFFKANVFYVFFNS